jgi:hypothetical protein
MHTDYNIASDIFYLGRINEGLDSGGIAMYHQRPLSIKSLDKVKCALTRPKTIDYISGAKSTSPYSVKVKNGIPEEILKDRDLASLKISPLEGVEFDSILKEIELWSIVSSSSRIPAAFD